MVDVHLSPAQEQAQYEELQKFCKAEFRSLAPVELETLLKKIVVYKDKKDKAFLRGIVEKIRNTSIFIREVSIYQRSEYIIEIMMFRGFSFCSRGHHVTAVTVTSGLWDLAPG